MKKESKTSTQSGLFFGVERSMPALLVVWTSEEGAVSVDRLEVTRSLVVGRNTASDLVVYDRRMSGSHFRITHRDGTAIISDLGSRNGTFVHGKRLEKKTHMDTVSLIRAGQTLFVFHPYGADLIKTPPGDTHQMAGSFHTAGLITSLKEAALSKRNVLLCGPTGTGKELAASALAEMMGKRLYTFNAARMTSKEEAASTLFGVVPRFFSNVDGRTGLIDEANGGVLFIDEVHNLGVDIQKGLLRVIETGETTRMGESTPRHTDVRMVLASNAGGETRGLADDLFARLRQVDLSPLCQRRADIPDIFLALLMEQLVRHKIDPTSVLPQLKADFMEAMILDGFPRDNVRGLLNLSDRIATAVAAGKPARQAFMDVFMERFGQGAVATRPRPEGPSDRSRYEQNKAAIIAAYEACDENISETVKELKQTGLRCSRRWLSVYLEKWGAR